MLISIRMWKVDSQDWECLQRIGARSTSEQKKQLKKIIDKGEINRADIDKIYDLLPKDANFYEFAQQLRLKPRSYEGPIPTPEFLALTQKLRQEQDKQEYKQMVSSVDSTQNYGNVNYMADFGKDMKEANRQTIAIVNSLITVAGAFVFGFYGINFAYPSLNLNIETRLAIGMTAALIVFFADLYFIVKSMDAPTQQQKNSNEQTYALNTKEIAKAAITPKKDDDVQSSPNKKKSTPKQNKKSEVSKKVESPKSTSSKQEKKIEEPTKVESPKPTKKAEPIMEEPLVQDVKEPEVLISDEPSTVTQRPKARRRAMKID
ncbi:ATPase, vacuolar ER assembly factor, Vma12 family-containing protein [Aphelenchoides bicaudatus]|nr:ATPase, vacuolar ER assembly factor, Vma12 family-containing protein [Aphelenchoides bicaudatus]